MKKRKRKVNDAPTTISRLLDTGIKPFYIGASVIMIVAQRFMRKVCQDCSQPITYDEGILNKWEYRNN